MDPTKDVERGGCNGGRPIDEEGSGHARKAEAMESEADANVLKVSVGC